MYLSSNLLKKYLNISEHPDILLAKIKDLGFAINYDMIQQNIPEQVLIGKIAQFSKHPQADKLHLVEVDCGDKGKFQIICGAQNLKLGAFVPVALVDCFLPAINLQITARIIRSITSYGMICSKHELGIEEDVEFPRIWLLENDFTDLEDVDLGRELIQKYNWLHRWSAKLTEHQPHNNIACSHFGIAIALNAYFDLKLPSKLKYSKINNYLEDFTNTNIIEVLSHANIATSKLNIEEFIADNTNTIKSVILGEINNIKITKSFFYTRNLLLDINTVAVYNWQDFANIFQALTNQKVQIFASEKIQGNIQIRFAITGEKYIDAQDKKYILESTDLVLTDNTRIIGLAGINECINTVPDSNTQHLIYLIGNYDHLLLNQTCSKYNINYTFHNINPVFTLYCLIIWLEEIKYFAKDLGNFIIGGIDYYHLKNIYEYYSATTKFTFAQLLEYLHKQNITFQEDQLQALLINLGLIKNNQSNLLSPIWRIQDHNINDINIDNKDNIIYQIKNYL